MIRKETNQMSCSLTKIQRLMIFIVAGWSGFFVMAVELLSSRLLSPIFGSSLHVWGGIITIFMLALSIGYLLGGKFSVCNPSVTKFSGLLFAAGITSLPIVLGADFFLNQLFSLVPDPRYGSLLAALGLFFLPTVISGAVSPYAVRLLVTDVDSSGKSSGFLYFVSTFGSAAGTILTSFYFVLWFKIPFILLGLIGISLVLSLMLTGIKKVHYWQWICLFSACLVVTGFLAKKLLVYDKNTAIGNIIHQEKSQYRDMMVFEHVNKQDICLVFNLHSSLYQSCVNKHDSNKMVHSYTKWLMASLYFNPEPQRILVLGLGGGVVPRGLHQVLPDALVDVVEIDPAVTKMASTYFNFASDARLRVFHEDGRVFVKKRLADHVFYDLIILDMFDGDYIPEHLLTKEFLLEVKSLLAPKGVLAANTFSKSKLYDYESATYFAVFGKFYQINKNNRVIFTRLDTLPTRLELSINAQKLEGLLTRFGVDSQEILNRMTFDVQIKNPSNILLDSYSPSNLLNHESER